MKLKPLLLSCFGVFILGGGMARAGAQDGDHGKRATMTEPSLCCPWFSGISAGVWWVQDYAVTIPYSPLTGDHVANFDTGFQINVTPIGYRLNDLLAISLETGFYQADTTGVTIPTGTSFGTSDGQLRLFPTTLNATFTIPICSHASLYAGVGVGVLYRELEATAPAVGPLADFHDSGWNATVQGRVGVIFAVGHCQVVNVGYRYNHVFAKPEDIQGHSIEAEYTFVW